MILRPVLADSLIHSLPVDPSATFESGNIAGLIEINGEIFCTVSNGTSIPPIGIIDDSRTNAFTGASVDESVLIPASPIQRNDGVFISSADVMGPLNETNIIQSSFAANLPVVLMAKKGIVTIPAGTPLNYDDGQGFMGFEIVCSYRFTHVGVAGMDSTIGSNQASIHFRRGIFSSSVFDTLAIYQPGCPLYVNSEGMLTATQTDSPVVALCLQPVSAISNELQFMWL